MRRDPLDLIRNDTRATPDEVARLRRRLGDLANPDSRPANRSPSPRWGRWLVATVAAAAVATLAVSAWLPQDTPVEPAPVAVAAGPLADGPSAIGDAIHILADGDGVVSGTEDDVLVDWVHGTLRVEVDPEAHVALRVRTDEGEVRVVGTVFTVRRDVDGTAVELERGHVAVQCNETESGELVGSGSHECRRLTAGMLLHQARNATSPQGVLDASTDGLARVDASSPLAGELRYLRIHALRQLGDVPASLAEAHRYVTDPAAPRRAEVCRWMLESDVDCDVQIP